MGLGSDLSIRVFVATRVSIQIFYRPIQTSESVMISPALHTLLCQDLVLWPMSPMVNTHMTDVLL